MTIHSNLLQHRWTWKKNVFTIHVLISYRLTSSCQAEIHLYQPSLSLQPSPSSSHHLVQCKEIKYLCWGIYSFSTYVKMQSWIIFRIPTWWSATCPNIICSDVTCWHINLWILLNKQANLQAYGVTNIQADIKYRTIYRQTDKQAGINLINTNGKQSRNRNYKPLSRPSKLPCMPMTLKPLVREILTKDLTAAFIPHAGAPMFMIAITRWAWIKRCSNKKTINHIWHMSSPQHEKLFTSSSFAIT